MYGETFYGRHTTQHQLQWRQIKKKKKKKSSFKSNDTIRKQEDGSYYVVSSLVWSFICLTSRYQYALILQRLPTDKHALMKCKYKL